MYVASYILDVCEMYFSQSQKFVIYSMANIPSPEYTIPTEKPSNFLEFTIIQSPWKGGKVFILAGIPYRKFINLRKMPTL